jgi:hypothetical protein
MPVINGEQKRSQQVISDQGHNQTHGMKAFNCPFSSCHTADLTTAVTLDIASLSVYSWTG